jgi:serine/threonine protein kinase
MAQDDSTETIADNPRKLHQKREREREAPARLGRYVILSELGRGGMSIVYVAYDPQLDRRVALKVVRGAKLSQAHRARLHREAQALARPSHPAVVTVFDVGDLDDDTFVAMELIDGMSLREWIKTPRTWREVVRVIVAAARGLAAAHAAGIVHRDIKPDNIVLATNGSVKLVDFGLARDLGDRSVETGEFPSDDLDLAAGSYDSGSHPSGAQPSGSHPSGSHPSGTHSTGSGSSRKLEAVTQFGHIVGTPAYMPPESRTRHAEVDERSDQFSLCVTLYEALFRQKPFQVSRKGVLDRGELPTVADDPSSDKRSLAAPPPRDTEVPAWLQKVVSRGLAIEPSHRYPSVDALILDLDRDPARTRLRVAAAAAALIGVAGVATFVTSRMMPSETAAGPTCETGDDRVAKVWNPERLDGMRKAAQSRGAPWAVGALEAFAARIETYGAEWKTMYLDACQATRVRGAQSEEALDLRMSCLDQRLEELGALVTLMADADLELLRKAGSVVDNLPRVAACADVKALRQVVRRPTDPAIVSRLDSLDRSLARLSALNAIGNASKAVELADELIKDAEAIGYAPALAQAMYWKGRSIVDRGGGAEAEAVFDKTFAAALSAGEDQMAADVAARLAQEALWAAKLPEFERWQRFAHALANRSGAEAVSFFTDQLGCMANHYYGKPRTRFACLQELARRAPDGRPNEWLVTLLGIAASEAGAPGESIKWLERGVELSRSENGADHPRTLEMRAYLCKGLNDAGDYKRSATECRDAVARLKKSAPDDRLLLARLELYLGDAEEKLGHIDDARALFDAAIAEGDDEVKLEARTSLSMLTGKHSAGATAIAEYRRALEETVKVFAQFNPRHPNIVAARHELGNALLKHGQAAAALTELARADADAELDEISPLELAQIRFARSQALLRAQPTARADARSLAADALAIYVRVAPDTERFRKERAAIEAWITQLDVRTP